MITHKCSRFKIGEIFPGHIWGDRIEGRILKNEDKFTWVITDDEFCTVLTDKKCPFCGIDLDNLINEKIK